MEQNFKNHSRMVPGYHYVLSLMLLAGLIGSIINLCQSEGTAAYYSASLITLLFLVAVFIAAFTRSFALKAQDRAIRAEENFRHYVLTGKVLPAGLSIRQIVGLRFASVLCRPIATMSAILSSCVPRSRCSGFTHAGLWQLCRTTSPSSISPLYRRYATRWALVLRPS
jgi:hypothetical protein